MSDFRMELDRDDFVVTFDPSQASVEEILDVVDEAGFPATVVDEGEPAEPRASRVDVPEPDFLVAARARAKREKKPMVLDFSAEWCAPCQKMIRDVFPDPEIAKLLDRFVFLTIDTDEYPGLTQNFGVVGMPDIRILDSAGNAMGQLLGYHDVERFGAELRAALDVVDSASDDGEE